MISRSRAAAAAGVRLLLLTVLLGLFAMHVLTAHGGEHHGVAIGPAVLTGADHRADAHGAATAAMVHPVAGGADSPAPVGSAVSVVLPGDVVTAPPGAPAGDAALMLCWLLVTAGAALLVLLLRAGRSVPHRHRPSGSVSVVGSSRPRSPPGRVRLHELQVLRV